MNRNILTHCDHNSRCEFSLCICYITVNIIIIFFRIASYATASTAESIYIIGGVHHWKGDLNSVTSNIVEYKNGNWEKVGNLANPRWNLGAITSGSLTMIVGGRIDLLDVHT